MKNAPQNTSNIFKVSERIGIAINPGTKSEFVPEKIAFEDHKHLVEQIAVAVNEKMPVLLIGETGTGKTSVIRYLAHETNNGFRRVNHNGGTTVDDIVGKILINEKGTFWVDGVLIEAMRKGYWYLADEINAAAAEINFAYHSLLDDDCYIVLPENNGEVVRPHPNFRFFAAMNPSTDYAGTKELNKALMSRFIVLKTDFSPPDIESDILVHRTGIEKSSALQMVKFAATVRDQHAKGKMSFVLSTRDLIMWAKMFKIYGKFIISAEMTVTNKVVPDELQSMTSMLGLSFSSIDNPKKKDVHQPKEQEDAAF
jgi:midasin